MTLTVVRPDDLADRILDREKHPQWQGERTKMVYAWPTNEALWTRYAELWRLGMQADRGISEATEFYRAYREAMDDGAVSRTHLRGIVHARTATAARDQDLLSTLRAVRPSPAVRGPGPGTSRAIRPEVSRGRRS